METFRRIQHYVGIDYSGAATPLTRLSGLRVFRATPNEDPDKVHPPHDKGKNWTRKEIAEWCVDQLREDGPVIIGIDHAFSFPMAYMERYGIKDWRHFLSDFCKHWPTHVNDSRVENLRPGNQKNREWRGTSSH
ncbi:MAG: hypothetical protein U5R49_17935 [Deltaproteobacteria bacterium]|nr:hypothetical protein [Deltaproteobacteria bacterium]